MRITNLLLGALAAVARADWTFRQEAHPAALKVDTVTQHAGYLDNNVTDKHLFYWFFESRNEPANDPVILWLNGGPGCSSMTGMLMELGPSRVSKSLNLTINPYSWNANASVIFLDQPVNTGFSYSSTFVNTTEAASKDVYAFLTAFMHKFPQYSKQELHIAGESYAGHYIPAIAERIVSHKNNINLKSIMLSNGLTNPLLQYASYYPMACGKGGYPSVLSDDECNSLNQSTSYCSSLIQTCYDKGDASSCSAASGYCDRWVITPYSETGRSVYDVRKQCPDGGLCYDETKYVASWLNEPNVKSALGIPSAVGQFQTCNGQINFNFTITGDWMRPFQRKVPGLLEKIKVLVFAGDADFICNWLGNRDWTSKLEWKGKKAFNAAETKEISVAGKPYGTAAYAEGLAFLRVYKSGHLVPFDQPKASLDLINRWMGGEWQ